MKLKMKYGFDGSRSHLIYRQKNNIKTNNMILTVFCPINISRSEEKIWEEKSPNLPQTQRPLMLQLGKENRDTIEVQKIFNEDIKTMETGFRIISDTRFTGEVKNMYDRKASDIYHGCTGAYCDHCIHSKSECMERIIS